MNNITHIPNPFKYLPVRLAFDEAISKAVTVGQSKNDEYIAEAIAHAKHDLDILQSLFTPATPTPDAGEYGELLAHYKSEAEDYYWLISIAGARWLDGYRVDEKTPTAIHEARLQHEARLRRAAKSNSPSAGAEGGNKP